jgi:hypothetical protein
MNKTCFSGLCVVLVGLGFASVAQAQVFTPTYQSPRLVNEVGIYLADGPGDLAVEGIWRAGPLGLRLGFVDGGGGLLSIGGELRNPIPMVGTPMGLAFTAGAQGLIGDNNVVGVQAGLSAGYTFVGQGLAFTPYLHPRVGLVGGFGTDEDMEFRVLADVGADIEFHNNILLHVGIKLDDVGSNFGVGLSLRR